MLEPSLPFYVCLFGAMQTGAISVPLFTLFGPDALKLRVGDCNPSILVTNAEKADLARGAACLALLGMALASPARPVRSRESRARRPKPTSVSMLKQVLRVVARRVVEMHRAVGQAAHELPHLRGIAVRQRRRSGRSAGRASPAGRWSRW